MTIEREMFAGRYVTGQQMRQFVDRLLDELADRASAYVRVDVVATIDALPADAPPNRMFRVAADPNGLYVGNGPGRKLSRATLTPLP